MAKISIFQKGISRWLFIISISLFAFVAVWMIRQPMAKANDNVEPSNNKKIGRNYDIRDDASEPARSLVEKKRQSIDQRQKNDLAGLEQRMKKAHTSLKKTNPSVDVSMNEQTGMPETVGVISSKQKLTDSSAARRSDIVRGFLAKQSDLFGLTASDVAQLKLTAEYENPAGNMSWVEFEQEIDGTKVFQGNIRAGLTKHGELVRTTGKLAAGIDPDAAKLAKNSYIKSSKIVGSNSAVAEGSSVAGAVASGAQSIGVAINPSELILKESSADGGSYIFEGGPFVEDIKAELIYFPLESGNLTLAWSMTLWEDNPAYYTIVDAETGTVLWRKNITEDQTQNVTYSFYDGDSPAPLSPFTGTPVIPAVSLGGFQAAGIPRTTVSNISELPAFDNLGWITDGGNTTTGNNVDAGLDVVAPNGIDPTGRPAGVPFRVFDFPYNPAPAIAGGVGSSNPTDPSYRAGAVTNLFFWTNRYHDILYQVGFTEASRNFQQNNFGRGGLGNDFVRAEAQDSSGTNNANFSTPADGSLPRMQMFLWPGPNPDYDGDLDQSISIHEMTHGTSNRLHGNATGLGSALSRGMGEGWSDFYARMILSSADEDVDGIYGTGGYATFLATANYTNNYYYGIRRFPSVVRTNLGPNGRPHNPLTLADTNPNLIDLTDGAFARGPFGVGGRAGSTAVHNVGEVWSIALIEVRARLIRRLGFAVGNQRMLQLTTDAMKLDPANPTLVDGRNALLAADVAGFGGADVLDIWAGFATRGIGFGATQSTLNANGRESFDNPLPGMGAVSTTDNGCRSNNSPDVGEQVTFSIPLTNPLGTTITDVSAQVVGGGTAVYGSIAANSTVTRNVDFQIPSSAACGSRLTVSVIVTSNLGTEIKTFPLQIGTPVLTSLQNFDGVAAPALPAGWATTRTGAGTLWTTSTTASDTAPNSAFTPLAATTGRADMVSPVIAVPAAGANQLTFRHSFNTEFEWDGGELFINIQGVNAPGQFFDILDAGGSFESGGYTFSFISAADGNTNALAGRVGWTGNSNGFITTTINLPAAAAGRNVQLLFIAGSDSSTTPAGAHWRIDSVSLINSYFCDTLATTTALAPSTGQYSDSTTLEATLAADCLYPTGTMEFRVDGVLVGTAAVNGTGTYSTNYTITNAPGPHSTTANFVSNNPYYNNSSGSNTLNVTPENAEVAFPSSNPFAVKVNSPGGTAGPITFCADIREVPDGSAGDISNATAAFSFAPVAGGTGPTVSVVTYSGGGVGGTRRACVTLTNVRVNVYDITVTVGGYYTGTGSSVLAVFDPSLGFVTGGGRVSNPGTGCSANFGISVKYQKNSKPQGSVLYMEHCPTGDSKLKSNALDSMSIVNGTAIILGRATFRDVGNYSFRMTVTDNGEPGSSDLFGLRITAPGGSVVTGYDFAPKTIDGGNIQVPQNPR